MAVIFISHRLGEVFDIADKITVLKDGQLVNTVNVKDASPADVVYMMVGRALDHYFPPLGSAQDFGEVVLQVREASNDFLRDVDLELRRGEIVGVAGLQGSGRTELAQALFGYYTEPRPAPSIPLPDLPAETAPSGRRDLNLVARFDRDLDGGGQRF